MSRTLATWLAPALCALVLAACATPTPYQPNVQGQSTSGGYSDARIEENRFRVTFSGNSLTSRETVETYLLYRAAELTLSSGYDYFIIADRQTDRSTRTYVEPSTIGPYGYWHPYWRYRGAGFGWRSWDPYWGDPFWADSIDVRTVDKYEAVAEIVMYKGAKPQDNPRAFGARGVMDNLAPRIVRPAP